MPENLREQMKNDATNLRRDKRWMDTKIKLLADIRVKNVATRLQGLESWDKEVTAASIFFPYRWTDNGPMQVEFEINLTENLPTPQLPRDIVRAGLASKLTKKKSYDGGSLTVRGTLLDEPDLLIKVTIEGYVPPTCRIEYEEVTIPARVERRSKIICDPATSPQDLDESAVEGDITAEEG